MKKCNNCGRMYSDLVTTCSNCGSPLSGSSQNHNTGTSQSVSAPSPVQTPPPMQTPPVTRPTVTVPQPATAPAVSRDGNMGKGILGAALYATGGAVVAGVLLNLGVVAALSGILTMFLAVLGYKKFSECSEDYSKKVTLLCIVISFVMLYLGIYVGYLMVCKNILAEEGYSYTLSEIAKIVANMPELQGELNGNFAMSAVFWGIYSAVSLFRRRK